MADILSSIPKAQVGPAPQSGSGSIQDNARPLDVGQAPSISANELARQNAAVAKPKLNTFEKAMAFDAAADAAVSASLAGKSRQEQADAGAQARDYVRAKPIERALPKDVGSNQQQELQHAAPDHDWPAAQAEVDKRMSYKEGIDLTDQFKAAYDESTVTASAMRMFKREFDENRSFAPDPLFDGLSDHEVWGKNMRQEDKEWVADSSSGDERLWKLSRLRETAENYKAMGAHGEGVSTLVGLSAGVLDPLGWVAGMGVGKVAMLAGVTLKTGMGVRAAQGALEGVAGNVLSTAAMQAAGDHITPGDYFYAAGYGAVFGAGLSGLHGKAKGEFDEAPAGLEGASGDLHPGAQANAELQTNAKAYQAETLQYHAGILDEAQRRAGPDATPEQIKAASDEVYHERANAVFQAVNGVLPDHQRVLPDMTHEKFYGISEETAADNKAQAALPQLEQSRVGTGQAADDLSPYERNQLRAAGVTDEALADLPTATALGMLPKAVIPEAPELKKSLTKEIESGFSDVKARVAAGERYGINPDTMPDNAERLLATEMLYRFEQQTPTFDERKLTSLVDRLYPKMAYSKAVRAVAMPQHILARAKHPAFRWIAANLLESPTQNAGPRATASLEHAIREREYGSFTNRYGEAYTAWRNENGGSYFSDAAMQSKHYERFNALVTQVRENRKNGIMGEEHQHLKRAADAMDEGYTLLAKHQVEAGTLGSENLKGQSSIGYTPRHADGRILADKPMVKEALRKSIHDDLHEAWKDFTDGPKLAREVAADYVDRIVNEGMGGVSTPAHMSDPHAAPTIRDSLAQHALSEADIDKFIKRVSRGGAKQTKHRLDIDTDKIVQLPDGTDFRIGDAFIKDQVALFGAQARRVNGEVTLARRGIYGKQGIDKLRELIGKTHNEKKDAKWEAELAAFDQTMSEFLGRPYGKSVAVLDNLRIAASVSRLGQAVIPQMAETASIASQLGTEHAIRTVKDLPRLISEVRHGKTNAILQSLEIPGGTIGDTHKFAAPWQSFDDIQLGGAEHVGVVGRTLRSAANAQYLLTGHRYYQAAQVRGVSEQVLHKVFRYVKAGEHDKSMQTLGISKNLIGALREDLGNIATFDKTGALTGLDVRQSANPTAMVELMQAVERGSGQIIQNTFIGERGAFVHDSLLRMLTQFRTYSIVAMTKQWRRTQVDYGTAKATGLLLGQMGFALPIHLARVMLVSSLMSDDKAAKYREQNLTLEMLGRATLNYATLSGSLGDILDAGAATAGLQMSGAKSGNQTPLGNIPALGYASSTMQALKDKDVSGIIKSLPGGNSIYLLPAVNLAHWAQKE